MPTIDVANQHMLSARAHGGEEMDWTALVGGQRIAAGLQPFAGRVSLSSIVLQAMIRKGGKTAKGGKEEGQECDEVRADGSSQSWRGITRILSVQYKVYE